MTGVSGGDIMSARSPSAAPTVPADLPAAGDARAYPLSPGEHRLAVAGGEISTRVGAAVCVAVRDPVLGIGGLTTLLLPPDGSDETWMAVSSRSMRQGNLMVEHLLTDLYKQGGVRQRFRLAVFGAARIGEALYAAARHNHAFLRTFLELEKLAVSRAELGGLSARRIVYRPATGELRVTSLDREETADVLAAETAHLAGQGTVSAGNDAELF